MAAKHVEESVGNLSDSVSGRKNNKPAICLRVRLRFGSISRDKSNRGRGGKNWGLLKRICFNASWERDA